MAVKTGTVIVGGGQAGLSLSAYLTSRNHPHVVLERGRVRRALALRALGFAAHADPELAQPSRRRPRPCRSRRLPRAGRVRRLPRAVRLVGRSARAGARRRVVGGASPRAVPRSHRRRRLGCEAGRRCDRGLWRSVPVLPRRPLLRRSSHSSTQPSIEGRNSSPPVRCWSSVPDRAVCRSPPSCDGLVAMSSSRWGGTHAGCAATAVGTSFTGSSGSAIRSSRSTTCRPRRGAHPVSGSVARTAASSSTWRPSRSSASRLPVA